MTSIDFADAFKSLCSSYLQQFKAEFAEAYYREFKSWNVEDLRKMFERAELVFDKFPTKKQLVFFSKSGFNQNVDSNKMVGIYLFECSCGFSASFNAEYFNKLKSRNQNSIWKCSNEFYDKCNKVYTVKEFLEKSKIIN